MIKSSEESIPIRCPEKIHFLQICHVLTHAVSEVGYVGALHQPVLRLGPKDQKSNIKQKSKESTTEH